MKKIILMVLVLATVKVLAAVPINNVLKEQVDYSDGTKYQVKGDSALPVNVTNPSPGYQNVWVTSGTITVDNLANLLKEGGSIHIINSTTSVVNFPAVQTTSEQKAASGDELLLSVSSSTYSTVNQRADRKSVVIQARTANDGKVYLRLEANTNIVSNGIELNPGQSWISNSYTGAIYIQAEAGKTVQTAICQEEY